MFFASRKLLCGLIQAVYFVLVLSNLLHAKELEIAHTKVINGNSTATITACTKGLLEIGFINVKPEQKTQISSGIEECKQTIITLSRITDNSFLIVKGGSEHRLHALMMIDDGIDDSIWGKFSYVFIYIGGLITAVVGKLFYHIIEPILFGIRIHLYIRRTKKFFISVADVYDRDDFKISLLLEEVANGDHLSAYVISTKKRREVYTLLIKINDWKRRSINNEEFKKFLLK